jgi:DNA sulfur modification protein DndD
VLERVKTSTRHHAEVSSQSAGIDRLIAELQNEISAKEQRLNKIRRAQIDSDIENEQSQRMRDLVERTRDTMRLFLEQSTMRKIERLAGLVTESFRFLLRKKSLVERIEIDPRTFRISMIDKNGTVIPKERLSEGEKQIFAIAVLWGLGRASTRPLPTIIDTPMGRLDSVHRDYLIDRYFPNASHQVVILSTDTEVDQDFYERLSPAVARSYHLDYSESERFTTAKEGYFWKTGSETEETAGVVS